MLELSNLCQLKKKKRIYISFQLGYYHNKHLVIINFTIIRFIMFVSFSMLKDYVVNLFYRPPVSLRPPPVVLRSLIVTVLEPSPFGSFSNLNFRCIALVVGNFV